VKYEQTLAVSTSLTRELINVRMPYHGVRIDLRLTGTFNRKHFAMRRRQRTNCIIDVELQWFSEYVHALSGYN